MARRGHLLFGAIEEPLTPRSCSSDHGVMTGSPSSTLDRPSGWILIPFFSDPDSPGHAKAVSDFRRFAVQAQLASGLKLAVVDDGSRLSGDELADVAHLQVHLQVNSGKAEAVRRGLEAILETDSRDHGPIVQYDGDGDHEVGDIHGLVRAVTELSHGDMGTRALMIAERYHGHMVPLALPESLEYRQSLVIFQRLIARRLGFRVSDWVSGARAYTPGYAAAFVRDSHSTRYGIEGEQLVVAAIERSLVSGIPLSYGRPRAPQTEAVKWMQTFDGFLLHRRKLAQLGLTQVVSLIESFMDNLDQRADQFDLDLTPIGLEAVMRFRRKGTAYTAGLPLAVRLQYFESDMSFSLRSGR